MTNFFNIFILIITFAIITKIKLNNRDSKFLKNIISIRNEFIYNYNQSKICLNKKCILKCLLKNNSYNKFNKYKDEDIPGKYPYNYPYLKNMKEICKRNTFILVSVISLCTELEERVALRNIYKNVNSTILFHYFIGITSIECHKKYILEKQTFQDISQIPIQESYINQTLFTLYLHKILPKICPQANYYGKMDVDQYINYEKLINLLNIQNKYNNIIYSCDTWKFRNVPVNQSYKYSSPKSIAKYYKKVFPRDGIKGFTGSFTLYPNHISSLIYKESLSESNIIRMEDQHIAWLIHKLNLKNYNITYYNLKCIDLNIKKNICDLKNFTDYGFHRIKGKKLYSFYKLLICNC